MNDYQNNTLIITKGIYYPRVLRDVKKSNDVLRPVFEGLMNSFEAIRDSSNSIDKGKVEIRLYSTGNLIEPEFDQIQIEDTGIGFNDENFERFLTFKDDRKGPGNKGSGRIQFIQFFDNCEYISKFREETATKTRRFTFSKSNINQNVNALVFYKATTDSEDENPGTTLILKNINAADQSHYNLLSVEELKQAVIKHFLPYLCVNRGRLPKIIIEHYLDEKLNEKKLIEASDIPPFDKEEPFSVPYSKISNSREIIKTNRSEDFTLMAFRIDKQDLAQNEIKLTSKGEIIDGAKIALNCLTPKEDIANKRYLFMVSGEYIDGKEGDVRGQIEILTQFDFISKDLPFGDEEILLDDIELTINDKVITLYEEIAKKAEEQKANINDLTDTFKLDHEAIEKVIITSNDSNEKILSKVYSKESEATAREDAQIKEQINEVKALDPTNVENYKPSLEKAINELFRRIPEANRRALTHYVARRRIVLDLFETILERELDAQKVTARKMDEKLLHNLIFQQSSGNSHDSDLWLVNEDFVFFEGVSDTALNKIEINGKKLIKQNLTNEEREYQKKLKQNRCAKEPDILLFPGEGKAIIIEFKDPDVDLSDHLGQIAKYAGLLRSFADPQFEFRTFYGYLIGNSFDPRDIRSVDPTFVAPPHFDYMFRPVRQVPHAFDGEDGSLYTEIISYTSVLERAKRRNQIFLSKLEEKY